MRPLSVLGHLKLHHLHRNMRDSVKDVDALSKHVVDEHHKASRFHLEKAKSKFKDTASKDNPDWVKQHVRAVAWAKNKVS